MQNSFVKFSYDNFSIIWMESIKATISSIIGSISIISVLLLNSNENISFLKAKIEFLLLLLLLSLIFEIYA